MRDKPLRNFDRFEKGHYYVYTGWKKLDWVEPKNSVSEHKICKCLDVWNEVITSASFANVEFGVWDWEDDFDDWVEVESPEAVFDIGDDCLRYDKIHQHWKVAKVHEGYFHNDKNKNGYNNEVGVHYICKRKSNDREETKKSKRYLCPHCKSDRTGLIGLHVKKNKSTKCGNCLNLYSYDKESDSLVMAQSLIQENVLCETPIKMSLDDVQKEPIKLHFAFKPEESREVSEALIAWASFVNNNKQLDKKDNVFKKHIRNKKYMKFVKEKK